MKPNELITYGIFIFLFSALVAVALDFTEFQAMEPEEQQDFLKNADFSQDENKALAEKFFINSEQSTDNINNNKEAFSNYMKEQGINVDMQGDIASYKDGRLTGANGDINIDEFKHQYNFEVDAGGNINLISKGSRHTFTGSIRSMPDGTMMIADGMIDDMEIRSGEGIIFDGDVMLADRVSIGNTENANIRIRTEHMELPNGNLMTGGEIYLHDGQWTVEQGNTATINNVLVDSYAKDTTMYFPQSRFDIDNWPKTNEKNFLTFHPDNAGLTMNGDDASFDMIFKQGNPYIRIDQNDFLKILPRGGEAVFVSHGTNEYPINILKPGDLTIDRYKSPAELEVKKGTVEVVNGESAILGGPDNDVFLRPKSKLNRGSSNLIIVFDDDEHWGMDNNNRLRELQPSFAEKTERGRHKSSYKLYTYNTEAGTKAVDIDSYHSYGIMFDDGYYELRRGDMATSIGTVKGDVFDQKDVIPSHSRVKVDTAKPGDDPVAYRKTPGIP